MSKRVAVILCGSGFLDGSEIRESVGVLWALSKHQAQVRIFAPQAPQSDSISHLTGLALKEERSARNMLEESARIARGEIEDLSTFSESEFDALVIPGGFGVAKTLCSFGREGAKGQVIPVVAHAILQMHQAKKPIGAVCIAPVLLALTLKQQSLKLTLGKKSEAAMELEKLGHQHLECSTTECIVDDISRVVCTPAYMDDEASLSDVFLGIERLVVALLSI